MYEISSFMKQIEFTFFISQKNVLSLGDLALSLAKNDSLEGMKSWVSLITGISHMN